MTNFSLSRYIDFNNTSTKPRMFWIAKQYYFGGICYFVILRTPLSSPSRELKGKNFSSLFFFNPGIIVAEHTNECKCIK